MSYVRFTLLILAVLKMDHSEAVHPQSYLKSRNTACGENGFICESNKKLRLCDNKNLYGPSFLCPANTVCNEESTDVCDSVINYIPPSVAKTIRCLRSERFADPTVPGCKGYILCVPKKRKFQSIRFKCGGKTIFNGITRTCSAPDSYKCPMQINNSSKTNVRFYNEEDSESNEFIGQFITNPAAAEMKESVYCKNYKFTLSEGRSRAEYFCPPRPIRGKSGTRCTVFSNIFCLTLERDEEDQFTQNSGAAYRKPRNFRIFNEIPSM